MNEELPPLSDELRALLDDATPPPPRSGFEDAVFSRLTTSLAVAPVAAAPFALKPLAMLIGGLVLFGAGVGTGWLLPREAPPPPQETVPVPVVVTPVPTSIPEPIAPSVREVPPPKPIVAPPKPVAPVVPAEVSPGRDRELAEERGLLEVARSALAQGRAAEALEAAQTHATRFPRGRLSEEREAISIEALRRLGRTDEAETRVRAFHAQFPESLLDP